MEPALVTTATLASAPKTPRSTIEPDERQEEEEEEEEEEEYEPENAHSRDDNDTKFPLEKRRRSRRQIHKISQSKQSYLQRKRLEQLFFNEQQQQVSSPSSTSAAVENSSNEATITIGNLTLTRISCAPNIYCIENFLNRAELEHLHHKIHKGNFEKSFVDGISSGETSVVDSAHRTSTFLSFESKHDSKIAAIERRAATLLGSWTSQTVEPLQLVRYEPGQFFKLHHDLGDLADDGSVAMPPRSLFCKRRLVTIFCYLNDLEPGAGGETNFAHAKCMVSPKAGRAVLFSNIRRGLVPDPRTVHAGEPLMKGIKYGLNIWICED